MFAVHCTKYQNRNWDYRELELIWKLDNGKVEVPGFDFIFKKWDDVQLKFCPTCE